MRQYPIKKWPISRREFLKLAGVGVLATQFSALSALGASVELGVLTGELKKWHTITLTFEGPETSETAEPNPFLDYRLDVEFRQGARVYRVPGYYAADGNAAETSADSGNIWRVHFAPDAEGEWVYTASFRRGEQIAVRDEPGASAGFFDGATGQFTIAPTDKIALSRDLRGKGRLQYVGEHYLQFAETGEYFLKGGADAPENFLAYEDFDNTPDNKGFRKSWEPHQRDWLPGDPTWQGNKGKGIIGAINYLASKGMNAVSFLTMNIQGDDRNVFPYSDDRTFDRFDCSKLDQWEIVLEHATRQGHYLHFKTQETENDQLLDGGSLGPQRKVYYRELIARFGHHLALNWNMGEENSQTDEQRRAMAQFFHDHDPYHHPIVIHTFPGKKDEVYSPLLGDQSFYTGASLQSGVNRVYDDTRHWVEASAAADKKWVVANDEQGNAKTGVVPDKNDFWHDTIRQNVLWGNLMAGGAGVEYYFGYDYDHSDLTCQDYRSRDHMWDLTHIALTFFEENVPYREMMPQSGLASNRQARVFANIGEVYIVYMPDVFATGTLSLPAGEYVLRWFDPRNGEFVGGMTTLAVHDDPIPLGETPNTPRQDWVALIVTYDDFTSG